MRTPWPVRLDEEAEADLALAANWYDEQVPGLGRAFILEVHRVLALVAMFPNGYPREYRSIPRALLTKYPYLIAYEVTDNVVIVLAVLHQSRHSEALHARLAGR